MAIFHKITKEDEFFYSFMNRRDYRILPKRVMNEEGIKKVRNLIINSIIHTETYVDIEY